MYKINRYDFRPANLGEADFAPSETVQGMEQSIEEIFRDMVLGNYSALNSPSGEYDSDTVGEIDYTSNGYFDPMNRVGLTLEEASMLQQQTNDEVSRVRAAQAARKQADEAEHSKAQEAFVTSAPAAQSADPNIQQ